MKRIMVFLSVMMLFACSTKPTPPHIDYSAADLAYISSYNTAAANNPELNPKMGKEYQVKDEWYFPMHDPSYDKEGTASWYGVGMEGKKTANGEIFHAADYTAAHPTLPMPSIVEVTNLDNGLKVNVRVNDRGPFHSKRIIDLSKAAAMSLDMMQTGTAHVRVRLLERETLEFMQYQNAVADNSPENRQADEGQGSQGGDDR